VCDVERTTTEGMINRPVIGGFFAESAAAGARLAAGKQQHVWWVVEVCFRHFFQPVSLQFTLQGAGTSRAAGCVY